MDMPNMHREGAAPVAGEREGARDKEASQHEKGAAAKREAVLRGELMANRKAKPPAKAVIGAVAALAACVIVIVVAVLIVKGMGA